MGGMAGPALRAKPGAGDWTAEPMGAPPGGLPTNGFDPASGKEPVESGELPQLPLPHPPDKPRLPMHPKNVVAISKLANMQQNFFMPVSSMRTIET